MSEPRSRAHLLRKFFPEFGSGTKADREAAAKINVMACEAILSDLIKLYDEGYAESGPGVLTLRLAKDQRESGYYSQEDAKADRHDAQKEGAQLVVEFMDTVIEAISSLSPKKDVLLMLCDNASIRLFALSRDYPAEAVQQMLEEVD